MPSKVVSFGIKHGTPTDGVVLEIHKLFKNPYSIPHLRALTGLHKPVQLWVRQNTPLFDAKLTELYISAAEAKGTLYIGCLGGKHRSPFIAELMGRKFKVPVEHRQLSEEEQADGTFQIFKVQKNILASDSVSQTLVYNKDGSIQYMQPTTKELHQIFKNLDQPKVYYFGYVHNSVVVLDTKAPEQEW